MDFSYENNKGLHAFFLALVIILGIFTVFAPVKSYAAVTPRPTAEFKSASLKFKLFSNTYTTTGQGFLTKTLIMNTSADASKVNGFRVYNHTEGKDLSDLFEYKTYGSNVYVDYKTSVNGDKKASAGDVIELTFNFSQLMPKESVYGFDYENNKQEYFVSSSFLKTVPAVPAQPVTVQAKAVQELPTVLGKVAGIVTLVGCLILGILLAVGLVKRLISLFIR